MLPLFFFTEMNHSCIVLPFLAFFGSGTFRFVHSPDLMSICLTGQRLSFPLVSPYYQVLDITPTLRIESLDT